MKLSQCPAEPKVMTCISHGLDLTDSSTRPVDVAHMAGALNQADWFSEAGYGRPGDDFEDIVDSPLGVESGSSV